MDFIKCSKYQSIKSCCCKKSMDDENKEELNSNYTFHERKNKVAEAHSVVNEESLSSDKSERYDNYSKAQFSCNTNKANFIYQPYSDSWYNIRNQISDDYTQKEIFSSLEIQEDNDFLCPRCGKRMQEPRLLPCLHPMCSPCVSELMSKNTRMYNIQTGDRTNNYYEMCVLCDYRLPNANSEMPPPHYPLQHRLVMDAIRCRLANRVLCDACTDEIVAVVQCSTCLRNFCSDCGLKHQQQVTIELRPSKHVIRPLWEATKVRRTALCQKHPTHALRYYCIACQQVTCKECMWSTLHRGHASEDSAGAGKRVALYLATVLQRAKTLLNMLLTQYDRNAFSNSPSNETRNTFISLGYRYVYSTYIRLKKAMYA
ncbi:tripartite motif-containing protein 42 isoform X2 [Calliopsis andreniformis]|uniref:tripartite motif-containing protein 42 isoform X2 n=1 Tax=Calliopsis andreniformis TaxID=337506 RepID=UPI003FCD1253